MTTVQIYTALLTATTVYAVMLASIPQLEPDLTWLEVVLGVFICLLAPYLDQRTNGPFTSEVYEQRVWLAFVVGGLPIVVWQIGQNVKERLQAERRIRGAHGNATRDSSEGATGMAADSGSAPEADD